MALRDYLVGEVAEDYADGRMNRREALRRLGLLGLAFPSAAALLVACGGEDDDDGASPTGETSPTTTGSSSPTTDVTAAPETASTGAPAAGPHAITFAGPTGELIGAYADAAVPVGAVLVVHENRGLTPHFFDVVGRLAADGYSALAVDLLSFEGGTASFADEGQAIGALGAAPLERLIADLRAGIDELERRVPDAKIGAVGFCFGGAMVWNLLDTGEDRLAAAVPFYGPAPDSPDFSGATAAVLGVYAELDDRVNASREAAGAALVAAGLTHEIRTFAGADHAFFNDTGERYNEQAATEAYAALLDWFSTHLRV
ncbi:MAG: dienelactone hydrolase family protein [Actinomycetota bacterium]